MSNENIEGESTPGLLGRVRSVADHTFAAFRDGASSDQSDGKAGPPTSDPADPDRPIRSASPKQVITDEERIQRYLRPHGGRMRQSELVECTGWSKAKVSRLLSQMEEDGSVDRVQIGREKIVALPGCQFEAVGSPFESGDVPDRANSSSRARGG